MSKSWRQAYTELTDFIAEHPEVKIRPDSVSTPENVRPEFYRLFNATRTAFVEEKFPDLLNEATVLSTNYLKAEQEVTELLRLEDVLMEAKLGRFLHDPIDQLRRGLLDPLFNLLKGQINVETFEEQALRNIEASSRVLYLSGYEKWVTLSLVKLLRSDKLFQVIARELSEAEIGDPTSEVEDVPKPEGSKRISFQYDPEAAFIVPDFIVHSAKINRYIALRSQIEEALLTASNASDKREWYSLDSIAALGPGLTLIYVADNPEEISFVADVDRICRPDLIIECRWQKDWYEKQGLDKVKLHHDSLKPKLGTYIVSREPVPEQAYKELVPEQDYIEPEPEQVPNKPASEQEQKPTQKQEPQKQEVDIHILTVGFDQSKLEPIISILMAQEDKEL